MSFAPNKENFEAYETYRKERPKSATGASNDVYGTKSIANTPSSAETAFLIMKKIHRTTGEVLPNKGRSLFENLQYIKTEPSVKVLQKTPWRQFFQEIGSTDQILTGKDLSPKNHSSKFQNKSHFSFPKTNNNHQQEVNYPQLFDQLVKRIQGLWKELHIPDPDRDFYSYALLQGPYQNPSQIDELTRYVKALHQHRRATMDVLHAINTREEFVTRCIELLASARRNSSLKFVSIQEGTHRKAEISDQNKELANEIQESLTSLRNASLSVGEKIKIWRQALWRPQAFIYRGQNYLLKMSSDMDLLKTDSVKRIFENLTISSSVDLQGIIFPNEVETGSSLLSQLSVSLREVSHGAIAPSGTGHGLGAYVADLCEEPGEAHSSILLPEVEQLNALIQEEPTLQRALALESKALMTRGTFIPLMRYEIISSQDQEGHLGGAHSHQDLSRSKKPQLRVGLRVRARYLGKSKLFPGVITCDHGDGSYDIDYDHGEKEIAVREEWLQAESDLQEEH